MKVNIPYMDPMGNVSYVYIIGCDIFSQNSKTTSQPGRQNKTLEPPVLAGIALVRLFPANR